MEVIQMLQGLSYKVFSIALPTGIVVSFDLDW